MRECAAYYERFRARLETDQGPAPQIAGCRGDVSDIDDGAAVDLPETLGIELVAQLAQRRSDQGLAVGREDTGVLVVRLEIAYVFDRDQPHLITDRRADPRKPLRHIALGTGGSRKTRKHPRQSIERALELGG